MEEQEWVHGRYLRLAHNVRDPEPGVVKAQILHSFGRAEHLEREALERLIAPIARYLQQDPPWLASSVSSSQLSLGSGEVEAVDARDLGGGWVLDQLWRRLGIDTALSKVARGRKLDAGRLERVLFALVASRALAPSSNLRSPAGSLTTSTSTVSTLWMRISATGRWTSCWKRWPSCRKRCSSPPRTC